MASVTENASAVVDLDGKLAGEKLKELRNEAKTLRKELNELKISGDKKGFEQKKRELDAINKQIDVAKRSTFDLQRVMRNLNGTSLKELERAQGQLTNEIRNSTRATDEERRAMKLKTQQLQAVKKEIAAVRNETSLANTTSKGFFKSITDAFNYSFGITAAAIASIIGMVMGFRSLAEKVAHLDDVYSDVRKTTGMTREEVVELNETFKKMDTRTSREHLNLLARDAGKLGLESKKDILDFVEAGNQINVALGEDLGADAIKQIGKMVNVYESATRQLQGSGLKEQMLAVGSAINELGASSTASEPYLVQFAGRLGGVSKQAKISIADILGFASALDQDMQAVEMSATAFQKFIMKLMGEPAKFAKLAGLEVKSFTNLLNTDTNAAIKAVLKGLNEKGGFQALIPIFKDMGMDGARAVGVLSAMAGSIEKIDEAQRISNQAMDEGVSITNEYNIKNTNLQASLEKARKRFLENALALGEKLTPAMIRSTNGFTLLIKTLTVLPEFIKRNQIVIISLTGAVLALLSAKIKLAAANLAELVTLQRGIGLRIKDEIILRKLMIQEQYRLALINKTTVAQKAAAIATATWRSALIALGGPLGLTIMAVTGLIAAIKLYDKHNAETVRIEKLRKQSLDDLNTANSNFALISNDVTRSMKEINSLTWEQIEALKNLTKQVLLKAQADLQAAKVSQLSATKDATRLGLWDKILITLKNAGNPWATTEQMMQKAIDNGIEASKEFNDQIKELQNNIDTLKGQNEQLTEILNAESKADAIQAKSVAQLEEKARLLSLALRHVAKDSDDYNRINEKLVKVQAELSKKNQDIISENDELGGSYKRLAKDIAAYKELVQKLVAEGKFNDSKIAGAYLKSLENQLFVINKIVDAGGDVNKFLTDMFDATDGINAELEEANKHMEDLGKQPWFQETLKLYKQIQSDNADQTPGFRTNKILNEIDIEASKDFFGLIEGGFDTQWITSQMQTAANASFDIWRNSADARFDYEMQMLNRSMERELKNKNLTEDQKDKIRARYEKKERAMKREAFRKQKNADIIQSIINTALAVTKALPDIPLSIAAGIAGLAQTTVIASQPIPSFYYGGDSGQGIGLRDRHGEIAGMVHKNEYVVPEWMRKIPTVMAFERIMEGIRTNRGASQGSSITNNSTTVNNQSAGITVTDPLLVSVLNRLNENIERGISSKFVLQDFREFSDKVDLIEQQSSL